MQHQNQIYIKGLCRNPSDLIKLSIFFVHFWYMLINFDFNFLIERMIKRSKIVLKMLIKRCKTTKSIKNVEIHQQSWLYWDIFDGFWPFVNKIKAFSMDFEWFDWIRAQFNSFLTRIKLLAPDSSQLFCWNPWQLWNFWNHSPSGFNRLSSEWCIYQTISNGIKRYKKVP